MDRVVGELHPAIMLAIEHAGPEQRMDIAVYDAHVTAGAPGDFAYPSEMLVSFMFPQETDSEPSRCRIFGGTGDLQ